jgi:hypothetical protein
MPLDATTASAPGPTTGAPGPALLSDADVGFGAAPKLLSDADVGFQSQTNADVNAFGQGVVKGTGAAIAGVGRQPVAAAAEGVQRQLAVMDAIDAGKGVPDGHDTIGYQYFSPAQRAEARADFTAANVEISKRQPNAVVNAGEAMQAWAPGAMPVRPDLEGRQTSVLRQVGGVLPAMAAGAAGTAVGGPVGGMLAAAAVAGSQGYNDTYDGEIAKGKTPAEAAAAGDKAALVNMAANSVPLSKVLPLIPVVLRTGFLKTVANVAVNYIQRGGEMAAGNSLGSIASNYVASQTYDPGRAVFAGSGDAAIDGFLTGLIVHGATSAVGAAVRPGPTRAAASISDVLGAPDVDSAIAAATQASQAPSGGASGAAPAAAAESSVPSFGDLFKPPAAAASDSAGVNPVMTTASGMKVPYRFDVAEAADLIPASGDLQPRDRAGRVASSGQIFKIANTLDPDQLHASVGPDQGAPSVSADGVVLAGNGRAAAIRQAYAMGNGDPYRAMVERYGFDTSGMTEPVLIRRLDAMPPEQARQIAVDSNVPTAQRMSGTEQAAIDAQSLTPDLLAQYNPLLTGGSTAAGNRSFVRAWVATLPESERNAAMGADGAISADGVRRLQGAMLSVAYADKGTLSRSLESTDDTTKALTGALTDAAPAWAQLQAEITAGRVPPEMNVAAQLTRAVDMVRQAREKGQTIGDALGQGDVLNPLDPVTAGFLRAFANPALTGAASRSLVADILRRYAIEAGKTSTAAGLFGDAEPPIAPADIVATVTAAAHAKTPIAEASAPVAPATVAGKVQSAPPPAPAAAVSAGASLAPALAPAGAAITPTGAFGRTAREIRGQQADMELADLMRTPQPGDARDIIPGAPQTKAEIEQSPSLSREAKGLRMEFREGFNEDEKANNEVYHRHIDEVTPSFENLGTMADTRQTQWQADERRVFGADPNGPPVSTEPLVQHFDGIFDDPVQKYNSYLRDAFAPFVKLLTDGNGDPIVLGAHELYGIRQEMQRTVKEMATNDKLAQVRGEFGTLLKLTDSVIMGGAQAYREMMNNYRNASMAINAGQRLAEGALKITNGSDRVITFGKFDTFMKNLWLERHGPNAYAPAKDIPQATWDHLMLLHERLARSASDQELARTRGSDTTQLMMEMGRKGLLGAAGVALAPVTHGLSTITIPLITKQIERNRNLKLVEQHRHPDLSKYPTPGP